ncbi:MAG: 30S ribosomal protein S3 [Kiritimatiellae bacterium]|nr:30S ribosomal protein S3 [Kiritimatiellia bacterium]
MGQKVNPIGFRVAVNKDWRSRWFADKRNFGDFLKEDCIIRDTVTNELKKDPSDKESKDGGVADIRIERDGARVRVTIHTCRPAVVIGNKGDRSKKLSDLLARKTKREVYVEVVEVRDPDANAKLVAESIAQQILHRVAMKRAMKRAQKLALDLGVDGIKISAAGRINGAEIARTEWMKEGKVPLHTLRANIDYGFAEANTPAGIIGVKVWICKKENYQPKQQRRGKSHAANA